MSFNLQKNEEQTGSPKRPNFDLAKNDGQPTVEERKKQPYWIYAMLALLIAGGIAWYYHQGASASSAHGEDTTTVAVTPPRNLAPDALDRTATAYASDGKPNPATETLSAPSEPAITESDPQAVQSVDQAKSANSISARIAAVFASGSSVPRSPAKNIALQIKRQLQADPAARVQVRGYASSEGDPAYNQVISQARADAYKAYLIKKGISASQIVAEGKSINDPIAPNNTEAGRKKNRRVEVQYTN